MLILRGEWVNWGAQRGLRIVGGCVPSEWELGAGVVGVSVDADALA